MRTPKICEHCQGVGREPIGEHYVSPEMAEDAGEPQMEGMFYRLEYEECKSCGGTGEDRSVSMDELED